MRACRARVLPERVALRADTAGTKSQNSRRNIGLPAQLVALLRRHQVEQDRERRAAAQLWHDGGWVFATPMGRPLNPARTTTSGSSSSGPPECGDGRLHDARHTAATVLLALRVPERVVLGLMGWSHGDLTIRYQHITDAILRDVANRIDGLIWAVPDEDDDRDSDEDGLSGTRVPA